MSQPAATIESEPLAGSLDGLRDARVGLAVGLVALGLLFHTEIAFAVKTWIESTAYNHCFLVIPIAGYVYSPFKELPNYPPGASVCFLSGHCPFGTLDVERPCRSTTYFEKIGVIGSTLDTRQQPKRKPL